MDTEVNTEVNLSDLPNEILGEIVQHITDIDLKSLGLASRRFFEISQNTWFLNRCLRVGWCNEPGCDNRAKKKRIYCKVCRPFVKDENHCKTQGCLSSTMKGMDYCNICMPRCMEWYTCGNFTESQNQFCTDCKPIHGCILDSCHERTERMTCDLHRCTMVDCEEPSNRRRVYCNDHLCSSGRCHSHKVDGSDWCSSHKCLFEGCNELSEHQRGRYCRAHRCVADGCYDKSDVNNVCIRHLCAYTGCGNIVKNYRHRNHIIHGGHCVEHSCNVDTCTVAAEDLCKGHTCRFKDCDGVSVISYNVCNEHSTWICPCGRRYNAGYRGYYCMNCNVGECSHNDCGVGEDRAITRTRWSELAIRCKDHRSKCRGCKCIYIETKKGLCGGCMASKRGIYW